MKYLSLLIHGTSKAIRRDSKRREMQNSRLCSFRLGNTDGEAQRFQYPFPCHLVGDQTSFLQSDRADDSVHCVIEDDFDPRLEQIFGL